MILILIWFEKMTQFLVPYPLENIYSEETIAEKENSCVYILPQLRR